jgi:glycosyltransferase involved in cell wall biosynthesis
MAVVSEAEASILDQAVGQKGIATAIPNGVDLDYFAPRDVREDLACVFVGAMDYLPNVDAVTWFADAVWPQVRERHPGAEFRIVGRKPSEAVQALEGRPGIVVTGTVPDVRAHLAAAAVSVVPMRLSRGLQNKVLESLSMSKATIVSPPALAALSAMPGRDVVRAESVDDWVTGICHLFLDFSRRRELGLNGRRFVEANHDWVSCLNPLTELIQTSIGRPTRMEAVA